MPEAVLVADKASDRAAPARILIIDDEPEIRESLETLLTLEAYRVDSAATGGEGLSKLETTAFDLVLLDLMLPDRSGLEILADIRERDPHIPVFLITAYGSIEAAVQALKLGASDYFQKPWDNEKLLLEIDHMISARRLASENLELKRALKQRYSFPNIVGKSDRMLKILDLIGQVARSRSTVLITGETGTGKELIAKAIHANSQRADQIFVAVNTGALPPDLLESTLFGHVKGAFTGAIASHKGYFETADRGSIFFDEISTIGSDMQAKLLRVIQEREFMPVGSSDVRKVDVRILAAANTDLKKLVDEGKFREDLYYRLNVINIPMPPLRDRKEDIPLLVEHFFQKYCADNEKLMDPGGRALLRFDSEAMQMLMDHNWPGNVRELENAVERAVVLATTTQVGVEVFPEHILEARGLRIRRDDQGRLPEDASLFEVVADFERKAIIEALENTGYSQTEAAERLRIPLSTLNQKIKRLDISIKKRGDKNQ